MTSARHHLRPALVALATLAGLLLVTTGASASCETMKSAGDGSCPASMASCCCSKAPEVFDQDETAKLSRPAACQAAETCCCSERPEVPAEPAPRPSRVVDDSRTDCGETLTFELADLRPSPIPPGWRSEPVGGPPHVPLFLRNSRFLI